MRTLNYVNFARTGSIQCATLALVCVDFRFRRQMADLLAYAGYRDFDLLALPGASKSAIDESFRPILFQSLDIILPLHTTERIIMIDHIDCGACGGSAAFANADEEEAFHVEKMFQAKEIITEKYPSLEIVTAYIDWLKLKILE